MSPLLSSPSYLVTQITLKQNFVALPSNWLENGRKKVFILFCPAKCQNDVSLTFTGLGKSQMDGKMKQTITIAAGVQFRRC